MSDGFIKSSVIRVYRVCAAPLGRRAVARHVRKGVPRRLEGPLSFLFGDSRAVDASVRATIETIESLRDALATREGGVPVLSEGFQSPCSTRPFKEVAALYSVPQEWGTFLHLLARAIDARSVVELGACAGISSCYLASAPAVERHVSIEGSTPLARIAAEHLARVSRSARVVNGVFEEALVPVLHDFADGIDLAFVDGHMNVDQLRLPVSRIVDRLSNGGLFVLDDIRTAAGTARLWSELSCSGGFSHAIDVGRFGICVRDRQCREPRAVGLAIYMAWLRRY